MAACYREDTSTDLAVTLLTPLRPDAFFPAGAFEEGDGRF
jgi:hypothetical protein